MGDLIKDNAMMIMYIALGFPPIYIAFLKDMGWPIYLPFVAALAGFYVFTNHFIEKPEPKPPRTYDVETPPPYVQEQWRILNQDGEYVPKMTNSPPQTHPRMRR